MPRLVFDRVGKFELIALLGEGGMAHVYLALFRGPGGFNKLSVIKRIRPELSHNRDFVTMFLKEAQLAARLNHPNVVQTFQVVEELDGYGLAMEYLEGQSLSEVFRRVGRRAFLIEEHLWILSQVLAGLHYAHTLQDYDGSLLGIVHRDVNPANVFVTYDGDVKLLDFGIAKVRDGSQITKKGTVKGKLGYCAPEQIQADHVDARADVFAVGVMLWEALAGKRMANGANAPEICQARVTGAEARIGQLCPDLPPPVIRMCDRATALDPDERYASAAEFGAEIDAYLHAVGTRVGRVQIAARLQRDFDEDRQFLRRRVEAKLTGEVAAISQSATTRALEPATRVDGAGPSRSSLMRQRRQKLIVAAAVGAGSLIGSVAWVAKHIVHPAVIASSPSQPAVVLAAPSRLPTPPAQMSEPIQPQVAPAKAPPQEFLPKASSPVGDATRRFAHLQGWWRQELPDSGGTLTPTRRAHRAPAVRKPAPKERRLVDRRPPALRAATAAADLRVPEKASGIVARPETVEPGVFLNRVQRRTRQHIDEEDPYHP